MDVIDLLNDLTGGQLLLWKVLLTSVIFACAGLQVLLAARFYEAATVPPLSDHAHAVAACHRHGRPLSALVDLPGKDGREFVRETLETSGLLVHVGHELVIENRRRDGGNEANCSRKQCFRDAGRHNR